MPDPTREDDPDRRTTHTAEVAAGPFGSIVDDLTIAVARLEDRLSRRLEDDALRQEEAQAAAAQAREAREAARQASADVAAAIAEVKAILEALSATDTPAARDDDDDRDAGGSDDTPADRMSADRTAG